MTLETVSHLIKVSSESFNDFLSTALSRPGWLQKAELEEIPLAECRAIFSKAFKSEFNFLKLQNGITDDLICAKGQDSIADTCAGDF